MGKFIITKRTNGEYQFNLEAANGRVILTSEGYATKAGCNKGIESVKTNAPTDARYDRKIAKNGAYYFNLKAANGEIIGTSQCIPLLMPKIMASNRLKKMRRMHQ